MSTLAMRIGGVWRLGFTGGVIYLRILPAIIAGTVCLFVTLAAIVAVWVAFLAGSTAGTIATVAVATLPLGAFSVFVVVVAADRVHGIKASAIQVLRRVRIQTTLGVLAVSTAGLVVLIGLVTPAAYVARNYGFVVGTEQTTLLSVLLWGLGVFVPMAWLLVRLGFAVPALVVENLRPIAALKRSFHLTRGLTRRLIAAYGCYVLGVLLYVVVLTLLGMLSSVLWSLALLFVALTPTLAMVLAVVLYFDAQVRQEFIDVRDV